MINYNNLAHLAIPDFILRDLEWAIESGFATPEDQVACKGHNDESKYI